MAAPLPLILLPPSEGKAPGGDGPPWRPGSMAVDLDRRRARVIAAVVAAMRGSEAARGKLLGVKGRALEAGTAADRGLRAAPTRPAIERYVGVLYDALDPGSLPAAERRRLERSVLIVSGLWGLVAPADPIPDYKLKMGATLPPLGKLSSWWRDELTARLADRAGGRTVWNLLPAEHAAAWCAPEGMGQLVMRFLEPRSDGTLATIAHENKSLKGSLVRFLLAHPQARPEDLAGWRDPSGRRYDVRSERDDGSSTVVSLVLRR